MLFKFDWLLEELLLLEIESVLERLLFEFVQPAMLTVLDIKSMTKITLIASNFIHHYNIQLSNNIIVLVSMKKIKINSFKYFN